MGHEKRPQIEGKVKKEVIKAALFRMQSF